MRKTMLLLAPIALAACTREGAGMESPEATAAAVGPPVECISLDQVAGRRPVPPRAIVFEVVGGTNYRNDLPDRCPPLENADMSDVLAVESDGPRLCRGDNVRVFDPADARVGGTKSFFKCRLGMFTPIARR